MSKDRSRSGGRLWTDPREGDEHQPWLQAPTRPMPQRPIGRPKPPSPEEREEARARKAADDRRRYVRIGMAVAACMLVLLLGESLLDGDGRGKGTIALPPSIPGAAPADERSRTVRAVYAAASPSVVNIQSSAGGRSGTGTGFVIDSDGTIVTNAHVVEGATEAKVRLDDNGKILTAQVVGRDESSDLAVVRVSPASVDGIRPLALAESENVQVGDLAVAIGYPLGLDRTATAGIVSGVGRSIRAPNDFSIDDVIQTDAPINPGNSGGPLLDSRGRVIGVNSQIATTGNGGGSVGIGFAVPSDTVREIIPRLKRGGTIRRAYLGVSTGEGPNGTGAVVGEVIPGGPADAAGLQVGDIVRTVDGRVVTRPGDISSAVERRRPGEQIQLEVQRGGSTATAGVTLGTRPQRAP